eukprot:2004407-Alexandrium_andersonii.AAC.1
MFPNPNRTSGREELVAEGETAAGAEGASAVDAEGASATGSSATAINGQGTCLPEPGRRAGPCEGSARAACR